MSGLVLAASLLICALPETSHNSQESVVLRRAARVFVSLPDNQTQYRHMFQRTASRGELDILDASRNRLMRTLPDAQRLHSRQDFERLVASDHTEVIVLLGHNEGGAFAFPSGAPAELTELAALARANNKRVVVISCKADCYLAGAAPGTRRMLSLPQAIDTADRFMRGYRTAAIEFVDRTSKSGYERARNRLLTGMDPDEFAIAEALSRAENAAVLSYRVKKVGAAAAGGAGLYQVTRR